MLFIHHISNVTDCKNVDYFVTLEFIVHWHSKEDKLYDGSSDSVHKITRCELAKNDPEYAAMILEEYPEYKELFRERLILTKMWGDYLW